MTNGNSQTIYNDDQNPRPDLPRISVVVCTYNRVDLLVEALSSLVQQTLDTSLYEVLVINNNSTDGTQAVVEEFIARRTNFRIFNEEKQGLSHARNRGWREARGEFVAFMDDDAKATPDWSERILCAFDTVQPKPTAVGGKILPWYECEPPAWFSEALEVRTWGEEAKFLEPPMKKFGFSGSNMTFPREILKDYGGFSSEFGMVGNKLRFAEEADLFLRIKNEEKRYWYDPNIVVQHYLPKKYMRVYYYFKRAYISGKARFRIENCSRNSPEYRNLLKSFIIYFVKTPIVLIRQREGFRSIFVMRSRELGSMLGRLIG